MVPWRGSTIVTSSTHRECPREEELLAYVGQGLAAAARVLVEEHLCGCSVCATVVAQLVSADAGPEPARVLAPGRGIDRYQVLDVVGEGAMGIVHAAYDPWLHRRIALKVLRHSGPELEERLLREARAMARVSSPHVVSVYDAGTFDGGVFVAMELIDGQTLRAWLAEQARPWTEVLDAFVLAGRGLAAAHRAGIVHRDFKPDNVLVTAEGRVAVTDFGLARGALDGGSPGGALELPAASLELTAAGAVIGTPAFMAPEQLVGRPVDARADLFSFCVALYRALYGAPPFPAARLRELLGSIAAGPTPPPDTGVPHAVREAVLAGLQANPDERPPSMEVLLARLRTARRAPTAPSPDDEVSAAPAHDPLGGGVLASIRGEPAPSPLPPAPAAGLTELHLKARRALREGWRGLPVESLVSSVTLFEQALVETPDDPALLAGYATARAKLYNYMPSLDGAAAVRALAARATDRAPHLAESWLAHGTIAWVTSDWVGAARALRKTLDLAPQTGAAMEMLGSMQIEVGLLDDGIRLLERALALDPGAETARVDLARACTLGGRRERARELLAVRPGSPPFASLVASSLRNAAWCRDESFVPQRAGWGNMPGLSDAGELVYAELAGHPLDLRRLERLEKTAEAQAEGLRLRPLLWQLVAEVGAFRHDRARTLRAVTRAADAMLFDLAWLDHCPLLAPYRGEPELVAQRARVAERVAPIVAAIAAPL